MKIGWGKRIAILYIGFVLGIMTLVFAAIRQNYDLVTEDYYAKELGQDEKQRKIANAHALPERLKIVPDFASGKLTLKFPADHTDAKGTVVLYRPSDKNLDQQIAIQLGSLSQQDIATKDLAPGLWRIQVEWEAQGKPFYQEQALTIVNN